MKKTLIVLSALLFVILGSCTNEWEQAPPKSESESYTPEEIVELYNSYSTIYSSYGNLSSHSAAGIDNIVVPFVEYMIAPMELIIVHVHEGVTYAQCEHQLVVDLVEMISENAIAALFTDGVTIGGLVEEDIPHALLALLKYHLCKHGYNFDI